MVAGEPDLIGTKVHSASFLTTSQGAVGDRSSRVTMWEKKPPAGDPSAETSGDLESIIRIPDQ